MSRRVQGAAHLVTHQGVDIVTAEEPRNELPRDAAVTATEQTEVRPREQPISAGADQQRVEVAAPGGDQSRGIHGARVDELRRGRLYAAWSVVAQRDAGLASGDDRRRGEQNHACAQSGSARHPLIKPEAQALHSLPAQGMPSFAPLFP
jgi:hypothetical protein